ncbi:MAG: amidohydrolase family protein [Alphaproteobacteria bacterium]|nr:amidohydrolase family protein [Alphaproteobacteria bacterium]
MITLLLASAAALAADCLVFEGATVYLPDGPAEGVSVKVVGARIEAVGPALDPAGCERVDASGHVLTPGFVDAHTTLGLVEVGMVGSSHDEGGGAASYRVIDGYNPRSSLIPVARVSGITTALAVPSGGPIAGQSAAVDLAGATQAEALIEPSVAFYAALGPNIGQSLDTLAKLFDDARHWARHQGEHDQNRTREYVAHAVDLEALQPLLRGERPLVVNADRASDIEALLRFAEAQQIRLILRGGAEAWLHAEDLAAAGVPVMLDPYVYYPSDFDQLHARPDNAALLHAAGVQVIIPSGSAHFARGLRQLAGNAAREGLPHQAALDAITSTPAEVFGLEGYGRIEPGAVANLALWTGDPLELRTRLVGLHVRGQAVTLETRQTQLRDRYMQLPGTPLPPLPLPESMPPAE